MQVFDANKVKVNISEDAVLRGWRDHQGLWRVSIDDKEDISLSNDELAQAINTVFDLPPIEQTIRCLRASIGFPTKRTWLKAIKKENFVGWLLVTTENVIKHLSQSKETKKGHVIKSECMLELATPWMPQKKAGQNWNQTIQEPLHVNSVRCG